MKDLSKTKFNKIQEIKDVIKKGDLINVPIMEKWGEKTKVAKITRFIDENEFCVAHYFVEVEDREIKIQVCWHSEIISRFPDKREYSLCAQTMRSVSFSASMMKEIKNSIKEKDKKDE